jgi:hypothetical protein
MKKLIFLLVVLFSAGAAYAEQVCYVQSSRAKILSAPSFRSNMIDEVGMGRMLTVKGRDGNWFKVSVGGKDGYILSLLVATHAPLKRSGYLKADDAEIKQGVRRRSSFFASAAAARGLSKEDRLRADAEDRVDYPALRQMESLSLGDDELRQFMEGAKP